MNWDCKGVNGVVIVDMEVVIVEMGVVSGTMKWGFGGFITGNW